MFIGCEAISNLVLSGFNTSNVTNMSYMFRNCKSLTSLDLRGFDVSKVTHVYETFRLCSELRSIDISSWDTSNMTDIGYMFQSDPNLTTIYVSERWDISSNPRSTSMFSGCTSLPNYNYYITDSRRAYYGGDGLGYLTYKAYPANP